MSARIIDRGRGPELEGTRVTIYRVMDFVREGASSEEIATGLSLSIEQVQAALDYLHQHREEAEREYKRILERVNQGNPDWVDAGAAKSPEELRQRILTRTAKATTHAGPSGQ